MRKKLNTGRDPGDKESREAARELHRYEVI